MRVRVSPSGGVYGVFNGGSSVVYDRGVGDSIEQGELDNNADIVRVGIALGVLFITSEFGGVRQFDGAGIYDHDINSGSSGAGGGVVDIGELL